MTHAERSNAPAAAAGLAWRQLRRGASIVLALAAGLSAFVVTQYEETMGVAGAATLRTLAANPAIRVMYGAPVGLGNAGGFTVWREGTFLLVFVGVWGLLAATRISRGEEDAGRVDLLLAGRLRLRTLVRGQVMVLGAVQLATGAAVGAAMAAAGAGGRGALLFGAAVALTGLLFTGVGFLTSQLAANRRGAAALAALVLGATLLLRMAADGVDSLRWLRWLTPFGLLEQAQPYAANSGGPLVVLGVAAGAVCVAAVALTHGRDLHAGYLPSRDASAPRTRLLHSPAGFQARRMLPGSTAWATGLVAYYVVLGSLAASVTQFLLDNQRFAKLAAAAGYTALDSVKGYLAAVVTLLAVPLSLYAAVQIAGDAADERTGRLTMVFALPVSRLRWLVNHLAVIVLASIVLAAAVGVSAWVGARLAGTSLSVESAIAGALNVLPIVWLSLGVAVVALGWLPHAVLPVASVPAVGGFVLLALGQSLGWPDWAVKISPFSHLNAVPLTTPDWIGAIAMAVLAVLLAACGAYGYARRDLAG